MWRKRLLVDAINAKEKFLRGFSHQLRTPIHGILGSADLLAEELQAAWGYGSADDALAVPAAVQKTGFMSFAEYSKYLNIIKMGGRDLVAIINNMITLNRWVDIALTDRHYAMHSIDKLESELTTAISNLTIGDMRYNCALFFTHDIPPEFETFWMDIDVLRDSLLPIVYNAIQHTPDGIVSVHASVDPESKQLTIDIKDTGRGIQQEDQRRIFEAYEKVDAHSARAGLGLTLASRFATLLHGSVALMSSTIGRGSHFRATFRDVECVCKESGSAQSLASKFQNLPREFYILSTPTRTRPNDISGSLCDQFASLLTRSGFTPSDSLEDSFAIVDASPDTEEHRTRLSQVPAGTACISLTPGLQADTPFGCERTATNVMHASGPFSTQTLASILEQADALTSELRTAQASAAAATALPMHLKASNDDSNTSDSDSSPDQGILTPAESSEEETGPTRTQVAPRPLRTSSRPTTLIVDDNIVNLRVMEMYCKKRGLPYITAKDGLQAVEIFTRRQSSSSATSNPENANEPPIELVFMDLQMPICDGVEATKQIRDLEQTNDWASSLIFVMTGQDTLADKTAAKEAGGDEYFVKPVILQQLDRAVRRHFPAFEVGKK
jgi:CheY-like chemotaxis protein